MIRDWTGTGREMLRSLAKRWVPWPYGGYLAHRKRTGLRLEDIYVTKCGCTVKGGPFAGMSYVSEASNGALIPKLLGSYELELHDVLDEMLARRCRTTVDIGCAEGYYAVGFALRLPDSQIYAFDPDARARELCQELANLNDVQDRITVAAEWDVHKLRQLCLRGAFLIVDCEGCEVELLASELLTSLHSSDLLVEMHPDSNPDIVQQFTEHFHQTHRIQIITSRSRSVTAYPALRVLPRRVRSRALSEWRRNDSWLFLSHRSNPAGMGDD